MGGEGTIRLVRKCEESGRLRGGWGGWDKAYGAYLIEAFSPAVEKRLCRFLSGKALVCVTLFSTPGLNASVEELFYFIYVLSVLLLNVIFSLSFNALLDAYHTLGLLLSYPEGISSFFSSSHLIQFSFWPCSLSDGASLSLLTLKTLENS